MTNRCDYGRFERTCRYGEAESGGAGDGGSHTMFTPRETLALEFKL